MTARTISTTEKPNGRLPLVIVGAMIFSTLLVAIALASGIWFISALVAIIPIVVWLNVVLARDSNRQLWDSVFWVGLALIVIAPMILKLTGRSISFLLELLLLAVMPALIIKLFNCTKISSRFRWAIIFLALFLGIAVLSTLFGRSNWFAAIYQAGTNVKYILMILVGASLQWSPRTDAWFWRFVRWFWTIEFVFVAWQWIHPGSYFSLFWGGEQASQDSMGLLPSRGVGTFEHPSMLAGLSAILFIASSVRYLNAKRWSYLATAAMYLLLLFASGERQELAGALLVVAALWLRQARLGEVLTIAVLVLPALISALFLAWPKISEKSLLEAQQWGVIGNYRIDHPRAVTYLTAATIANINFPLGSGLGTFGGAGAKRFDDSYYWELGFNRYWWFTTRNFLMDTFWPNIYAEGGWIGLVAMALSLAALLGIPIQHLRYSLPATTKLYSQLALGTFSYTVILSLTSPSFQDPSLFFIAGALFGIAMRYGAQSSTDGNELALHPAYGDFR